MKNNFLYLLFFTFLSLILFWPIFLGKVNLNGHLLVSFYAPYSENLPYKNTGWDQLRIYFPFYKVTLDGLRSLQVPLWNPYAFSGHPHMADFQTGVFYPLNILGFVLPQVEFWHFLRITPMILAAFFTFIYLSNLKLSNLASFYGALIFGFSPFILTWGEEVVLSPHSVIWLPLILFAIDRVFDSKERLLLSRFTRDRNDKRKYLAIIALASAASFLGGYMQTTIYMFIFVFAYLIFRLWQINKLQTRFVKLVQTGFGLLVGVGIAAVQLLPSAELYFNSGRSSITLRETLFDFLLPPQSLLTYLAPDFFGHPATHNFFRGGVAQYYEGIIFVGVGALIFAAYTIFCLGSHLRGVKTHHLGGDYRFVRFLAIFGVVTLSTTLDLATSRLFLTLPIPFLSTSIANRVLFIPAFCVAILAAVGFDAWYQKRDRAIFKVIFAFGLLYFTVVFYLLLVRFFNFPYVEFLKFSSSETALISLRNLAVPIAVFGAFSTLVFLGNRRSGFKKVAAVLLIVVAFLHIFYFSQKYFTFNTREYIFPQSPVLSFLQNNQGYFRSWGVGDAALGNNFATQYDLFWPEGYDSLNSRSYAEFTYAMQGNNISDFYLRSDAGFGAVGDTAFLIENPNRRKLLDMVGVKYVIVKSSDLEVMEANNFKKVFDLSAPIESGPVGGYSVFENPQVMPRVILASSYEGPPTLLDVTNLTTEEIDKRRRKLIFNKLLADDFDFRNVLILEKPSTISPQFGPGKVEILSYKPLEVEIWTSSDQSKLLFISDNYYPGWKASVDGDETEILRANYTFRAVPLTRGEHLVRFYYDPISFKAGLFISVVSLVGIGFLIFKSKIKKRSFALQNANIKMKVIL